MSMEKYGKNSDVSHAVDLLQSQVIISGSSQPEILQETNFDGAFNKIIILSKKLFYHLVKKAFQFHNKNTTNEDLRTSLLSLTCLMLSGWLLRSVRS